MIAIDDDAIEMVDDDDDGCSHSFTQEAQPSHRILLVGIYGKMQAGF